MSSTRDSVRPHARKNSPSQLALFQRLRGLSLVIPVYECATRLPGHCRMVRGLSPVVDEVLWVATPSADGSHEIARQEAQKTGGRYLEVPPGLYQAWNGGVRQVTGRFIYISTVGEEISLGGLRTMRDLLDRHQADLCFSPPEILPATKERIRRTRHWPVFRFARFLASYDQQVVPLPILARLQILSGVSCLLGSCASCLFSGNVLREKPFPVDFLHYGDTAWFYRHVCSLRVVYWRDLCSSFHVHDFSRRILRPEDLHSCMDWLAADYRKRFPESLLPEVAGDLQITREKLDELRKPHPYRYWWMNPVAWWWRFRRDWLEAKILLGITPIFRSES